MALVVPLGLAPGLAAGAAACDAGPAATDGEGSKWMEDFLAVLRWILIYLGGDPGQISATAKPDEAMSIVQQKYYATGIPATLSMTDRATLHVLADTAQGMLANAPAAVDSTAASGFRLTLKEIQIKTSPPPAPIPGSVIEP